MLGKPLGGQTDGDSWCIAALIHHRRDSTHRQSLLRIRCRAAKSLPGQQERQGFLPLEGKKVLVRLDGKVFEADLNAANDLPADIEVFILTVLTKYNYLLG